MNKPIDIALLRPVEPFADYQANIAARIDRRAEAQAQDSGARVGISRAHESAALHVAGEATYIDDIPELAGTLHCALGLSPVANGRLKNMKLEAICAMPGVVAVLTAADIPGSNDCDSLPPKPPHSAEMSQSKRLLILYARTWRCSAASGTSSPWTNSPGASSFFM